MNVILVTLKIRIITNQVFPITPLPYPPLPFRLAAAGNVFAFGNTPGKVGL